MSMCVWVSVCVCHGVLVPNRYWNTRGELEESVMVLLRSTSCVFLIPRRVPLAVRAGGTLETQPSDYCSPFPKLLRFLVKVGGGWSRGCSYSAIPRPAPTKGTVWARSSNMEIFGLTLSCPAESNSVVIPELSNKCVRTTELPEETQCWVNRRFQDRFPGTRSTKRKGNFPPTLQFLLATVAYQARLPR